MGGEEWQSPLNSFLSCKRLGSQGRGQPRGGSHRHPMDPRDQRSTSSARRRSLIICCDPCACLSLGATGVVNLAGEPVATRWTPEIKGAGPSL
eukprot:11493-Pelagomonas_calceolata.AAC.1